METAKNIKKIKQKQKNNNTLATHQLIYAKYDYNNVLMCDCE